MTPAELLANGFSRIPPIIERAVTGLDAQRLATRPAAGSNSIAWLSWHTARGQDSWISDLEQSQAVWTAGKWHERFSLPLNTEENGFGMTDSATTRVVATSDLLTAYLHAVTARTLAYLDTLSDEVLDDIVDATRVPAVTRGVQLFSILEDGLQHAGQASYARGILDHS